MKFDFHPAHLVAFARREIGVLSIVFAIALALLAFLGLADEVMEGETGAFDEALLLALRTSTDTHDPLGPRWLEQAAGDITALGGVTVLALITLGAIGFLLADGKPRTAMLVIASVGGGTLLSTLLKLGYARPRPDLVPHGVEVYTASFPSGHALGAAVVFLTLGGLLSWSQPSRRIKIYILSMAVVLTILVGVSRVYLGVHWPTDVLAGWAIGAAWALAWSGIALVVARRSRPAPPGEGPAG
ncbi:phosphatase PAP2 family protein [Pseudoxanthobacter sp. M-2]|uniref:phosphatase PAP2 family protein n=1 Tax=Pseudoxanthobacter sp. M-2 TaxID=3078754 RepID=UPI0038FBF1D7